ncbi:MAG TPA: hypothetical protein PLP61_07865 [Nocardioides sp.]|uniref:hypothetical protein n=1 Tax=Nocardioides sp. TaxID=35761 RepID=UPI002CE937C1|nr:hypothetical protein [Nocardioides sp.]HQR26938.1 hypothetical protein [Nocardioides sp.]
MAGRRRDWWLPTLAGAVTFWLVNLLISLTPIAADYRSAMSIPYRQMLVEAAVGGLLVASAVAYPLLRHPGKVPGRDVLTKGLVLGTGVLALLTVLVEVPSKLRADVADPGHWLVVATAFNALRVLALAIATALVVRARAHPHDDHHPQGRQEAEV